jgi:kynurenine formamidase
MTKIIDLSFEIASGMDVYSGDPEVKFEKTHDVEKDGYSVTKLSFGTHTSTHIDAQAHMIGNGKTLSDYDVDKFSGKAILIDEGDELVSSEVLIFREGKFSNEVIDKIIELKPKMVGFGRDNDLDIPKIKRLLDEDILVVGPLRLDSVLPNRFLFNAFPLMIKEGDGSPVRAVAFID